FHCYAARLDLHSFPTRRSSDLGMALVYGATGTTNIPLIAASVGAAKFPALLLIGSAMMIVGFGFKVALAPFHVWTPDVYEGAPRSEEHTSELQSRENLVCRLLL